MSPATEDSASASHRIPGWASARGGDFVLESRVGDKRHGRAFEIAPVRGLVAVAVVDQHRFGGGDAGRPQHVGRHRGGTRAAAASGRRGRLARRGRRQRPIESAGADVRLALGDGGNHLGRGVGQRELERKFLFGGELPGEIDVESGERAVRSGKVERGARPDEDDELAELAGRRQGFGTCERSGRARCPPRGQSPTGEGRGGAKDAISIEWRWRRRHCERRCERL